MVKVKVLREFRDKYTGDKYRPGDEVELDESRKEEILAAPVQSPLIEVVKDIAEEENREEKKQVKKRTAKKKEVAAE